jgi:UPF0755 protein
MAFLSRFIGAAGTALEFHIMRFRWQWVLGLTLAALTVGYIFLASPPRDFPTESIVIVAKGESARDVAETLHDMHIVRRPEVLRVLWRLYGHDTTVQAGAYRFESPHNVVQVARRIASADFRMPAVRLTLPEGLTVREIAQRVSQEFPHISMQEFEAAARQYEGYLFPDTYFFPPRATSAEIVDVLRKNFDVKTQNISADVTASGHTLPEIVIMGSLIEKEARTTESRRIISGILWARLAKDMPLQVDAVFGYIFNRDTYSPSFDDLAYDSPYNTYLYRGLPPGPIANPGLDALRAAANPASTTYLYYLTDEDGVMRYGVSFAEHTANQKKYLR